MKAKLIVEGREFTIEINDPELEKLLKPQKKTGYERVSPLDPYWAVDEFGVCQHLGEEKEVVDEIYDNANYYSDETVAENNARADKLMRQLRRYAVEQRKYKLLWNKDYCNEKWSIVYDCKNCRLVTRKHWDEREAFVIYFDTEEIANLAVETFHDELIWYFTEYKDSL